MRFLPLFAGLLHATACGPRLQTAGPADSDSAGWEEAFTTGERLGARSLEEAVLGASLVPAEHARAYWDGVGHGLSAVSDLDAFSLALRTSVPPEHHPALWRGAMRAAAQRHAEDPRLALAEAQRIHARAGGPREDLEDGVRIGLQRALGYDLPYALDVAATYPRDLHPALYEELGWRLGDEVPLDILGLERPLRRALGHVPGDNHCAFVHGVLRGVAMRGPEEPLDHLLGDVPEDCSAASARAVGWVAWELGMDDVEREVIVGHLLSDPGRRADATRFSEELEEAVAAGRPTPRLWTL